MAGRRPALSGTAVESETDSPQLCEPPWGRPGSWTGSQESSNAVSSRVEREQLVDRMMKTSGHSIKSPHFPVAQTLTAQRVA